MEALPIELLSLADGVLLRRASLQAAIAHGYEDALSRIFPLRQGPEIRAELPPGMLEALVAAELCGRGAPLEHHYCRTMPAQLAAQLRGQGKAEARLFSTKLALSKLPRLQEGLERLFALVAAAGVQCEDALGAASPRALIDARPTLGELYAGCHFGRSMPMLYAYRADLLDEAWRGRTPLELIDARYVGPLVHELSHLRPRDPALVPAPANLHEALAAWIGSRAWPGQLWPEPGAEDALPGGAFFASVGGWIARAIGESGAIRAQAGALDLASAQEGLGPDASAALRLYGFLPFLDTGATHLLSDAFRPDRWWKLIDLHRDPALAEELRARCVEPLLREGHRGPLQPSWDAVLDAIPPAALPAARDQPGAADEALAVLARQALLVRTSRAGLRFVSARAELNLALDAQACWLSSDAPGPDALGAPPRHPYPPALCKRSLENAAPGKESPL